VKFFICVAVGVAVTGLSLAVHVFVGPADNIVGLLATAGVSGIGIPALVLFVLPWIDERRQRAERVNQDELG